MINFEATELRLGLPGGNGVLDVGDGEVEIVKSSTGKRGFSETVDLKLNLSTSDSASSNSSSGLLDHQVSVEKKKIDPAKPPAKYVFLFLVGLCLDLKLISRFCLYVRVK